MHLVNEVTEEDSQLLELKTDGENEVNLEVVALGWL